MLSPITDILAEAQAGRMFILVDDEQRENEGDLVIPAQFVTPDAINFMAKHGRGLICLALTSARVRQLNLSAMATHNQSRNTTAFTVSIEARDGITTGISAADRARTIQVAIDPTKDAGDIVSPGHVFPLEARDGGVLMRAGHTEAAVDIARLAGLNPSGVICEIMNEDGSMARLPDLITFAAAHNIKIGTIADLIQYRRRRDILIERVRDFEFHSENGGLWRALVYRNITEGSEHLALVKGTPHPDQPVLVRMHAFSVMDDVLRQIGGRAHLIDAAMRDISAVGSGVLVMIRHFNSIAFTEMLDTPPHGPSQNPSILREYGMGAQILLDLGVRQMTLLSNATGNTLAALDGFGLRVVGTRALSPLPQSSISQP